MCFIIRDSLGGLTDSRRVRAVQAVDELQEQSVKNGLDKMDLEEVNREIQAVRKSDIL